MKKLLLVLLVCAYSLGNAQTGAATEKTLKEVKTAVLSNSTISSSTVTTGNVGGFTSMSTTSLVMSVAGAYATGDYMGTSTTPQTFTNVTRSAGSSAIIKGVRIVDKITTTNVAMELWIFSATFTAPTDNAAWAITDAEALTFVGIIYIDPTKWYATSNNQVYYDDSFSIPTKPATTTLYYALVARGTTPSFTSGDLSITIGILQD